MQAFSIYQITHMEMIKGIQGHSYSDELVVPIIENTSHEGELTEPIAEAVIFLPSFLIAECINIEDTNL